MFSFAGVTLPDPGPDVLSWAQRHLSYQWLRLWDQPWQATGARPWLSEGPLRLNTLLWPSGASRWAVFHAAVDDAAMNAIRGATGSLGQPLVIDDGSSPVLSVAMYPLPPRPLSQVAGADGLQLLTLVDRRAYWPWVAADPAVTGGSTTWAQLFAAIAGALGVPVEVDPVPGAYLSPPADVLDANDGLPALLDAACLSCGLRFAAALDGTSYRCWSSAAARAQLAANLAAVTNPRVAGGTFLQGTDVNGILPAAVRLVFPRSDDGVLAAAREARPVTLASLGAAGPAGNTGGLGGLTRTLYSTALATYVAGSLTDDAALTALATQAAADWYAWQAAGVHDAAFAGVAPWLPTGLDGLCEYAHAPDAGAGGGVLSRFRRDTYFDQQADLFHWTADLAPAAGGAPPFSGAYLTSSGQTITSSTLTTLTWATAGYDTDAYFSSGLPTRLTAPSAGYYRITARVNWNIGPAVPALILSLSFNGTSTYEADYAHAEATTITESNSITTVAHLAAGDYVEAQVKQTSGGSMSFLTGSGNSPTFQIEKVG